MQDLIVVCIIYKSLLCHNFQVVGILMRARRQGLVNFEGEMLYQRRDDHVLIRLLKMPDDLINEIEKQKDELKHHPSAK